MVDFDNTPFAFPPPAPAPIARRMRTASPSRPGARRDRVSPRRRSDAGYGDLGVGNGEFYVRLGAQVNVGLGDVKLISGDTQWFVGPRLSW